MSKLERKHTRLPWRQDGTFVYFGVNLVANIFSGAMSLAQNQANAALVVRACNSYYDLLAVLDTAAVDIEDWASDDGEFTVSEMGLIKLAQCLRTAIAKAKP